MSLAVLKKKFGRFKISKTLLFYKKFKFEQHLAILDRFSCKIVTGQLVFLRQIHRVFELTDWYTSH